VLNDGVLQQVDTPRAMYDRPANVFVAGFIGSPAMNLHTVALADGGVQYGEVVVPLPREIVAAAKNLGDTHVTVGVRPESYEPVSENGEGLPVEVTVVEELGADAFMYGTAKLNDEEQQIIARVDSRRPPEKGSTVHLKVRPGEQHVFSASTGERLG
jgi:multiple sugar transport system ATP-binding protein